MKYAVRITIRKILRHLKKSLSLLVHHLPVNFHERKTILLQKIAHDKVNKIRRFSDCLVSDIS